ncbi:MAG: FkbM family methyltransferase [Methyloprofundus sp.]|nr:FkbM family methyltransferase [Methyloprofundus sp.]
MSIISYAQNYEDVMLWRALKNIEKGFFIDVGANDPELDSVTKLFYDKGWRGINIEPVSQWFDRLEECRMRDVNLQIAVGNATGKMALYELPDTGLSTMDKKTAERHEKERGYKKVEREVLVETLTDICKEYHEAPIHFLKIDVEGAEKAVLEGFDLIQIRPWIIVIESTLPNTQIEDYELWENHLLEAEYEFAYFDGLNRFYIADEHKELAGYFKAPPNVFDEFITQQQLNFELRAQMSEANAVQLETDRDQLESIKAQLETDRGQLESIKAQLEIDLNTSECNNEKLVEEAHSAKENIDELNQSSHHWNITANQLDEELKAVYASKSWQIMLHLRKIMHLIIRLTHQSKQLAKTFTISAMRYVITQPRLKEAALAILFKFPRIKAYLNKMALRAGLSTKQPYRRSSGNPDYLDYGIEGAASPYTLIATYNEKEALLAGNYLSERLSIDEILMRIRAELLTDSRKVSNDE